jgi:hypothetical protein
MGAEPAGREPCRLAAALEVSDSHGSDLHGSDIQRSDLQRSDLQDYVHHIMGLLAALPISWVLSLLFPANLRTTFFIAAT